MLTKEIGLHVSKAGTTAAGVAAITATLKELGVPLAEGALKDGSGLDRGNRVTCRKPSLILRKPAGCSATIPRLRLRKALRDLSNGFATELARPEQDASARVCLIVLQCIAIEN